MIRHFLMVLVCTMGLMNVALAQQTLYETTFEREGWDRQAWIQVKSPRWEQVHEWIQHEDHIANPVPANLGEQELGHGRETYVSMVLAEKVDTSPGVRVRSRMAFEYDQAPQIVVAPELGSTEAGKAEYREHYEIVLFARGVNIWHHTYADGRPYWRLVSHVPFTVEADQTHEMSVTIDGSRGRKREDESVAGRLLTVEVAGQSFSYYAPGLPAELHVGLIGYASTNRFYDFAVEWLD